MNVRSCATLGIAAVTGLAAMTAAVTASAAPTTRPVVAGRPVWTTSAADLGAAPETAAVAARVYLSPRGGLDAVRQVAEAVSTPGSPSYKRFLTSEQFHSRFAPRASTVRAVTAYLRSNGFRVTGVGEDNRYVAVRGTVADAERGFGARIRRYRHDGRVVQAPATGLSIPTGLSPSVLTITGLDTTPAIARPASPPPAGFRNAGPCSTYYGQKAAKVEADGTTPLPKFAGKVLPYAVCGYTGPQFRSAYEGATALDGTGTTVAIVDAYAAPTIVSDAATYAARNGDRAYATGQLTQTAPSEYSNSKLCAPSDWYGEETLDVEAVHAMAQAAKIHYYAAASCLDPDFIDALAHVVKDDTAQIVSSSWGGTEAGNGVDASAYEAVFLQGATEGISFLFSSGDDGDAIATSGTKQTDYPASDPYVTAVGGTATAIGAAGNITSQTGWGTENYSLSASGTGWDDNGFWYGAGGGTSSLFAQPNYQSGVTSSPYRQVPDVAMDADVTTGMLIGETQMFPHEGAHYDEYRVGGTSLAAPLFAGMTALAVQNNGGAGAGLLNAAVYTHVGAFTDVAARPADPGNVRVDYVNGVDASAGLVYSVRTFNEDSSLSIGKGYDQVTGVGVPNSTWFSALG